MARLQVIIPDELYYKIASAAARDERSVSNFVRITLIKAMSGGSQSVVNDGTDTVAKRSSMPSIKNRDPLDYDAELDDVFSKLDD